MSILNKLRGLKGTEDFTRVIPELDASLQQAEADLASAERGREDAIFTSGEAGAERTQKAIEEARDRAAMLKVALDGARRRKQEAADREQRLKDEAEIAGLRSNLPNERNLLIAFGEQAEALTRTLTALKNAKLVRDEINRLAGARGRPDLRVSDPLTEFSEANAQLYEAFWKAQDLNATISNPAAISSPAEEGACSIVAFWPQRNANKHLGGASVWSLLK